MSRVFLDRFTPTGAILEREDGSTYEERVENLPPNLREGSVLLVLADGSYQHDPAYEAERRRRLFALQESMFSQDD